MATTTKNPTSLTRLDIVKMWVEESNKDEPMTRGEFAEHLAKKTGGEAKKMYAKLVSINTALKKKNINLPPLKASPQGRGVDDINQIKEVLGIS